MVSLSVVSIVLVRIREDKIEPSISSISKVPLIDSETVEVI